MKSHSLDATFDALAKELGDLAKLDYPIGRLTTYRVGGKASLFVEATCVEDLCRLSSSLMKAARSVPVLVLGGGSNLLISERGFDGVVLHLAGTARFAEFTLITDSSDSTALIRVGAALGMPVLARRSVDAGFAGLEWAVGIPGTVGGGVRMNAGGHGSDVSANLVRYGWFDLSSGLEGEDTVQRLEFGYRHSSICATQVVLWAEFKVVPGDRETGKKTLASIVRWRRQNQPGGSNAGSVFKNPKGDSAGRLIEAAGLKGYRLGSASVSLRHANFIQVDEGGKADDVYAVVACVAQRVKEKFGITLTPEIRLIGFTDNDPVGLDRSVGSSERYEEESVGRDGKP